MRLGVVCFCRANTTRQRAEHEKNVALAAAAAVAAAVTTPAATTATAGSGGRGATATDTKAVSIAVPSPVATAPVGGVKPPKFYNSFERTLYSLCLPVLYSVVRIPKDVVCVSTTCVLAWCCMGC